eukprot:366135-Chlamydomonas_euryale.AAC.3
MTESTCRERAHAARTHRCCAAALDVQTPRTAIALQPTNRTDAAATLSPASGSDAGCMAGDARQVWELECGRQRSSALPLRSGVPGANAPSSPAHTPKLQPARSKWAWCACQLAWQCEGETSGFESWG